MTTELNSLICCPLTADRYPMKQIKSTAAVTEGNSLTLIAILVQQSMRKVSSGWSQRERNIEEGALPGIRDVAN